MVTSKRTAICNYIRASPLLREQLSQVTFDLGHQTCNSKASNNNTEASAMLDHQHFSGNSYDKGRSAGGATMLPQQLCYGNSHAMEPVS
jgi:hypothetical protein